MGSRNFKKAGALDVRASDGRTATIHEWVETTEWKEPGESRSRSHASSTFWVDGQLLEARDSGFYDPRDGTLWRRAK